MATKRSRKPAPVPTAQLTRKPLALYLFVYGLIFLMGLSLLSLALRTPR